MNEAEHAALVRQDRLDRLAQMTAELAERERRAPGSVPDFVAEALHSSFTSWTTRLLRLGLRA